MAEKMKPKITLGHILVSVHTIYGQAKCPRCKSIAPYYNDCPVCMGYVVGCDVLTKEDTLCKYIAWLKE
jgi:hypothetical protein